MQCVCGVGLTIVDLTDNEGALIWKDGRLAYILGPGRHAFWNEPYKLDVEVFDTNTLRFEHAKMEAIVSFVGSSKWPVAMDVAGKVLPETFARDPERMARFQREAKLRLGRTDIAITLVPLISIVPQDRGPAFV